MKIYYNRLNNQLITINNSNQPEPTWTEIKQGDKLRCLVYYPNIPIYKEDDVVYHAITDTDFFVINKEGKLAQLPMSNTSRFVHIDYFNTASQPTKHLVYDPVSTSILRTDTDTDTGKYRLKEGDVIMEDNGCRFCTILEFADMNGCPAIKLQDVKTGYIFTLRQETIAKLFLF
jgi:hypothetical protein